jgi:hypothetical protein
MSNYKEIGRELINLRQKHRDEIEVLEEKFQKAFEEALLEETGIGKGIKVYCEEGKEYVVQSVSNSGLGMNFSLVRALRYKKDGTVYAMPFVRAAKFFSTKPFNQPQK